MRQKLTSLIAKAVLAAMNPDSRPITLTKPIPLIEALASVWAPITAGTAWVTAVSKPKELWINERSLSIVLGTPTTAIFKPRRLISSPISQAPRSVPSPPMVIKMFILRRSRESTISPTRSPPPLELPKIVPPFSWISSTISGLREIMGWGEFSNRPW